MKRMFRVALSCTVAVEAESDADAISAVRYIHIWDPSVRKLSVAVLSTWVDTSWVDKPKEAQDVPAVESPVMEVESVHDAAVGEQAFKDSNSSTYRDPAPTDEVPF